MNKQEFDFILQGGEGFKVEFKKSFDKSLAKEIVAFANTSGGRVFLGIDDDGEVKGINATNRLKSQIQSVARDCDPSIDIRLIRFEDILIIEVDEGRDKPYQCSTGFYLRMGANSQKLTRDEIMKFIIDSGKVKFDEQLNNKFKFPDDFDNDKFEGFLKESKLSGDNKVSDILINLALAERIDDEIQLNNTGVLFFGKEIGRFIRQNFISCVLYKGDERVDIIDKKDFNNDLLSNYEDSFKFLKQHLRLKYVIKGAGPRQEILEIPEEALKEALINAIVHRDYFERGAGIFVEIFDDRVEIYNKGKLLFDRKDLGKISVSRNPLLFDMFHRMNLIEKAGSGINRIKRLTKEREISVRFETTEFFRIIFERVEVTNNLESKRLVEGLVERLVESQKRILELTKENPFISKVFMSEKIGISTTAVDKNIEKLKEKGLLKRIGSAKGGYWEVISDERGDRG